MSPQSRMVAQFWYGLMLARGLKPRKLVWRDEAWRMARGPNLAPKRVGGGHRQRRLARRNAYLRAPRHLTLHEAGLAHLVYS